MQRREFITFLGAAAAVWKRAKRPTTSLREAGYLLLGLVSLATVTGLYFWLDVPLVAAAFTYLVVLVLLSLVSNLSSLIVLSFIGVGCLSHFFAPPIYSFRVDSPQDLITISAFVITSFAVNFLVTRVRVEQEALRDANQRLEVTNKALRIENVERKWAEQALRESEDKLRQITETVPGLVWSADPAGEPTQFNQRLLDYSGMRLEDFQHRGWETFLHPADFPETAKAFYQAIQTGTSYEAVHRLRRADGEYRWHHARGEPLRDREGRIVQWYGLSVDIDEGKKAEDQLRRSEAYLAEAQRLTHSGSAAYNETKILYLSEEACRMFGFDPLQGVPSREAVWQRIHPDDLDRTNQTIERAVREKRSFGNEFRIIHPDGTIRHVEAINDPVFSASGELLEIIATGIDVTERKRAEDALRESERSWRSAIDGIAGLVSIHFPNGEVETVNRQCLEYFGRSLEELKNWGTSDAVHPEDLPRILELFTRAMASGIPYHIDQRLRRFDGEYRWFNNRGVPIRDDSGRITRWYVLITDIEDRKRAEEALRSALDGIAGLIVVLAPNGEVETVNRQALEYFGRSLEELKNWGRNDTVHPGDLPRTLEVFKRAMASGNPFQNELRLRHSDGEYRWFDTRHVPIRDDSGRIARWYVLATDIEDRKRAEHASRSAIDGIAGLVVILAPDGEVETVNRQVLEYYGRSLEEIKNWATNDALHPEDLPRVVEIFARAVTSGIPFNFDHRLRRFDGEYRWFDTRGVPIRDDSGRIARWYVLLTDIEDRTRALAQLEQMQSDFAHMNRVATMGQLTASITHEVNQPITAAVTYALAARRYLGADPPNFREVDDALSLIVKEGNRAGEVVERVRALIKKVPVRKDAVAIDDAILEVIALTRTEAANNSVSVRTQFAEDLPPVQGDRVQLQQVMLNLVVNAIQAMSGIGEGARELQISIDAVPSEGDVLVGVRDTGPGLSPESLSRLFEPFYTTKPEGMGMGLSICRSIIEAHGGRLWATRCEPRGALFQFTIPAT
jgi:PAS domain S-box-containing protein